MGSDVINPSLDGIHIFGSVEDFDFKSVTTRAESDIADSHISEMTMFVFDKNNQLIQGYSKRTVNEVDENGDPTNVSFDAEDKCTSAVNINKANPTFLIDTKGGIIASLDDASPRIIYYDNLTRNDNDLSECKIYIVANAYYKLEGQLDDIKSIEDLENIKLDIDATLAMPMKDQNLHRGFPMIGTHAGQTFDLSKAGTNQGAVAKIPLKKLYSKVRFTMQVNADQVVAGQTPKFKIDSVQVFNVPKFARLGRKVTNNKPYYSESDADDYIVEMVGTNSYTPSDYYHFTEKAFTIKDFSRNVINHTTSKVLPEGSEYLIEFGFYMPEHKVTPNYNESTYPDYPKGMEEKYHQYYKPELVGAVRNEDGTTTNSKHATYVRIHGKYTDHNGQIKTVRYDIYLGQDNTDDFTVKRNQLLNNKLVITGLTNYYDAYGEGSNNISIDHRVDVDYQGFNLSMERTAILDAHFEVRPLDIELSPGSTMTITIPESYRKWIAMESDEWVRREENYDPDIYISKVEREAVRKYFTTDLVSELNKLGTHVNGKGNGGTITIKHDGPGSKIYRIWFYIDENPNVYDKLWKEGDPKVSYTGAVNDVVTVGSGDTAYTINKTTYRICPVQFSYVGTNGNEKDENGNPVPYTKTETINFQQWNLWRVWAKDANGNPVRYYDIEHEEEYLNNYASDQQYGSTQDGMPWGLDKLQLSDTVTAFQQNSSSDAWIIDEIIDYIVNRSITNKPKYDFYNTKAEAENCGLEGNADEYFPYYGYEFCKKIITKANASSNADHHIKELWLTQPPKSAVEYCYNKNKRNGTTGLVDADDLKWYLPAIDEIQDIASVCYGEFEGAFQKNFYWSSQPAYQLADWTYRGYTSSYKGKLYYDNKSYARATRAIIDNVGNFTYEPSGMTSTNEHWQLYRNKVPSITTNSNSIVRDLGYKSRTAVADHCRIRAVYRSGTK